MFARGVRGPAAPSPATVRDRPAGRGGGPAPVTGGGGALMDALERLRRADPVPAPGRPSWEAVAARLEAEASRPARPPRPVRARRTLVVAMLLLLLVAGGA